MSLELFLAQYHVWLTNDTHALLVFVPGHPLINAVITTAVFFAVSQELSYAINALCAALAHAPAGRYATAALWLACAAGWTRALA